MSTYLKSLFAVTSIALILITPAGISHAEEKPGTISVSGTGTANVAPDLAIISLGVVREAKTAREALDANNKAMAAVLNSMKEKGIAEKDLQTSNFNIQPRYHYPKRKANGKQPTPKITGYVVSNNLAARVRDLSKTGEILDLVVTLGVNSGGNIQFTNDNKEAILKLARIAAVQDALDKAETLTSTAGVRLGRIINISENFNQPRPVSFAKAARAAVVESDAAVPIASGENSYRVNVQISWEIAQ